MKQLFRISGQSYWYGPVKASKFELDSVVFSGILSTGMDIHTSMVYFPEANPDFEKKPIFPKEGYLISGLVGQEFYMSYKSYPSYFSFGSAALR